MLTKDIISGFNLLSLAGFVIMGLTLALNRSGRAGKTLSLGLMCAGTALVFFPGYICGRVEMMGSAASSKTYAPRFCGELAHPARRS